MEWRNLKSRAKAQLKGRWCKVIIALMIIGILVTGSIVAVEILAEKYIGIEYLDFVFGLLLSLLLGGAYRVGVAGYMLDFVNHGQSKIGHIFGGFKHYFSNFSTWLWYVLFGTIWYILVILGVVAGFVGMFAVLGNNFASISMDTVNPASLLLIFPLIIVMYVIIFGGLTIFYNKIYSYAAMFYIKAANQKMSGLESMNMSKKVMRDHRWQLFGLHMSFALWIVLSILTLGIALIWVIPYMQVTQANFMYPILKENGLIDQPVEDAQVSDDTDCSSNEGGTNCCCDAVVPESVAIESNADELTEENVNMDVETAIEETVVEDVPVERTVVEYITIDEPVVEAPVVAAPIVEETAVVAEPIPVTEVYSEQVEHNIENTVEENKTSEEDSL